MRGEETKTANILSEMQQSVASWVVPKMRKVNGSGKKLKFISYLITIVRFMTAWRDENRFFDEKDNFLVEVE